MARIDWKGRRAELEDMLAAGASHRQIADHFGCSKYPACQALRRFGLCVDEKAANERRISTLRALHKTPEFHAIRVAGIRKANQRGEVKAKRAENMRRNWADPNWRAKAMSSLSEYLKTDAATESRRRAGSRTQQVLKAKRARKREDRMLEAMTPFERKLWLVENGRATITERRPIRRPDANYSYGVADYGG